MENTDAVEVDDEQSRGQKEEISVICKVDVSKYQLDVPWTSGALFHFGSDTDAEHWTQSQSQQVEGSFRLKKSTPGDDVLDADYYLHYHPPG